MISKKAFFKKNGYVVIPNFYSDHYYKDILYSLSNIFKNGKFKNKFYKINQKDEAKKISEFVNKIKIKNPYYLSSLYENFGFNLSMLQFLNVDVKKILKKVCSLNYRELHLEQQILRMDPPNIKDNLTGPHQDHLPKSKKQYNDKLYGITLWCPFRNCNSVNGGISVVPGSQKYGYITEINKSKKIYSSASFNIKKQKQNILKLLTPIQAKRGDLVILNSLVVHKSNDNKSEYCRFTAQFRLSKSKSYKWN